MNDFDRVPMRLKQNAFAACSIFQTSLIIMPVRGRSVSDFIIRVKLRKLYDRKQHGCRELGGLG